MSDELNRISITELCAWLHVDADWVRKVRRGRDASKMPPPLLGDGGLVWLEADILTWLSWWHDRQEAIASGLDPAGVPAPCYLTAEPDSERVTK